MRAPALEHRRIMGRRLIYCDCREKSRSVTAEDASEFVLNRVACALWSRRPPRSPEPRDLWLLLLLVFASARARRTHAALATESCQSEGFFPLP